MELHEICSIFYKLPEDIIIYKILPYAYNIQSETLCQDIRSFHYCFHYINNYYIGRYRFLGQNYLWKQWLANDIAIFMNDFIITRYGYTDFCLEKYRKLFMLKNKSHSFIRDFVWYISNTCNSGIPIKINIGILEPDERSLLLSFIHTLHIE